MTALVTIHCGHRLIAMCAAACYNSHTTPCVCLCGGLNHGVGHDRAVQQTRDKGVAIAHDFLLGLQPDRHYEVRLHLPPAPDKTLTMF
jgi:hypothetical protein